MSSITSKQVILVTGANRGIGFELVKKLAETTSTDHTVILLGCRDLKRGAEAISRLQCPPHLHLLQLDVSSLESIIHARNTIIEKYGGHINIVINNAAIGALELTLETARKMFATNYYGIKLLNEYLFPLMKPNGRIINVASECGSILLSEVTKSLQEKYTSTNLSMQELDNLVEEFISSIENQTFEILGYNPKSSYLLYSVTKAAVLALTRVEARIYADERQILILAVCPGFCATELNQNAPGGRPAALGADSILYAVQTIADELQNGGFYLDGRLLPIISNRVPQN